MLWEETYGSDSNERGEQAKREDFQHRRQEARDIVKLENTAIEMRRMNASTWLVDYEADRLLLADQVSKKLVRVYDKMGVSDKAVKAWRDWNAQAVAVRGAGALYIARPQYLIGLTKLSTDRTWIKDLPEAEYDPHGFLYTGATGYRVPYPPEKTFNKIASAAGQIKKGTPGCYRFFYKEKMYPILPGNPPAEGGLGLEEMGAWRAWVEWLPFLDGAATTHLTDRYEQEEVIYQRPKTWPDEPTMAAGQGKNLFRTEEDGAPRIALKSVLGPPVKDERRKANLREKWLHGLPEGKLIPLKHGGLVVETHQGVKYRIMRNRLGFIRQRAGQVPMGKPGVFRVRIKDEDTPIDVTDSGMKRYLIDYGKWEKSIDAAPKATLKNSKLCVTGVGGEITRYEIESIPGHDVDPRSPGACVLFWDDDVFVINPERSSGFRMISQQQGETQDFDLNVWKQRLINEGKVARRASKTSDLWDFKGKLYRITEDLKAKLWQLIPDIPRDRTDCCVLYDSGEYFGSCMAGQSDAADTDLR